MERVSVDEALQSSHRTKSKRRQSTPVWIAGDGDARVLERVPPKTYDEAWLQRMIHSHPSVLPISEIEPACWPAFPVCTELPLPSGFADNLLVNPDGNLIVVECKLWRNPELRRKVVAQIIDYAKDLMVLDYADLEQRVSKAKDVSGASLYEIAQSPLEESEFVDALSRNLRMGRLLLVVAGDGITESVESITDYLQQHAGIHFTLALVQLAVFDVGDGSRLVVPSVPMRSVNVVRGIVEVRDGRPVITPPPTEQRAETLTEKQFLEELEAIHPGTVSRLEDLLRNGEDLGLHIEVKKTLIVRLPMGDLSVNVLVVSRNGQAGSDYIWWWREDIGAELLREFLEDWSRAIPGSKLAPAPRAPYIRMEDGPLMLWDVLDHGDAWLMAVRRFRDAVLEKRSRVDSR